MLHVDEAITEYCAQQRMHDCLAAQLWELSALHRRVAPGSRLSARASCTLLGIAA